MTSYEAYQVFEHLRDSGTIQAAGEMLGQAFAKGLATEAAKLDQEMVAATQLADELESALTFIPTSSPLWERAKAALRAAGRIP